MKNKKIILLCLALLYQGMAIAHNEFSQSGWFHPLSGIDHLLAMLAVGTWSAIIGGRAIYTVPAFFVIFMFIGSITGIMQLNVPYIEEGIIASVIFLGLAISINKRFYIAISYVFVGLFGFFHGYAHGYEIPVIEDLVFYIAGFVTTTVLLHITGVFYGLLLSKTKKGKLLLQISGVFISLTGIYLLYNFQGT